MSPGVRTQAPTDLTMEILFLGTGAGVPSRERNVASLALRLSRINETWLFDCGEGTQHRILVSPLSFSRIRRIFITHLHGDHIFGLPGLLATAGLASHPSRIDLYGPEGIADFLEIALSVSQTNLRFPLDVHTFTEDWSMDIAGMRVTASGLDHGMASYGFRIDEPDRQGHFDANRAAALGVPSGPLFGQLKRGERVVLPDGTFVDPAGLTGPSEPGRSVVICGDTRYSGVTVELARGCDLLVHEATFAEQETDLAAISRHSTASDAARVAREAGVRRLAITHISSRYGSGNPVEPQDLLEDARRIFPQTVLAEDLASVVVPRRMESR